MAIAQKYNEFDDPGLVVQEEVVEEWTPTAFLEGRKNALIQRALWLTRRLEMGMEMPKTTQSTLNRVKSTASWMCVAAGIEGIDWSVALAVPDPNSTEGKALSKSVLDRSFSDWVYGWGADADEALRYYVTVTRRAVAHPSPNIYWGRELKKKSNRCTNALVVECQAVQKVVGELASFSKG